MMLQNIMPRAQLFSAAVTLRPGAEYDLDELTEKLVRAGYTRSSLVEGVGQFALRGGILDVFSPACDNPVRAEFFGDELDTMGFFDPITQRRTENADEAVLLPVAETEPHLHPEGLEGLLRDLNALIARQKRRKTPNARLIETLERDAEKLGSDVLFPAADRYMEPEVTLEELKKEYFVDTLASFDSPHTYNSSRTNNLVLACKAINGTILNPGEEFSFNNVVGERTAAKGYQAAIVYQTGGVSTPELGGGVCQVASTIYYCTLQADLEVTHREPHMPTAMPLEPFTSKFGKREGSTRGSLRVSSKLGSQSTVSLSMSRSISLQSFDILASV